MHAWIQRCKETYSYHTAKLKGNPAWSLRDTSEMLNRSIGAVSQDLKLASWMFTHRDELEQFEFAKDALGYIKDKQLKIKTRPLE